MLDVESDNVRFLTIHGMGGVGKTTLAKVVFNRLSSLFHGCNFLSDVRESSERHGMVYLQKQMLSKFLDSRSIDHIRDADDGINMIKRVLCNKKVLIVLDDVDEEQQLRSLAEKGNWFGSGSRIIITTRYKSVLIIGREATVEGLVTKSANVSTFEVHEMEFDHALMLFSRHAFRRDFPPENYISLSENIVSTLGKLPLAIEVTGSFLSGKSEVFWEDTLNKLEKAPSMEVQKTLMITYERLDDAQRQVFLDISCFFVNKDKTYPFYMWEDCGYCPHNAIEVLSLMSLIKIKDDNTFWMHDQVRDLGRDIIRQENSKYPCERSRVWNHQEALRILRRKEGSSKIEALSLGYRGEILSPGEVANLQNMRFFEVNGVFLVGDFNNLLSSLKWLSWRCCPNEFVATNFHVTNLVILDLSCSDISEEWIGWNQIKVASTLKVLDLSCCNYLMRTPDLSMLVSLERLILEGCCNLIEIDASIGKLKLLTALNLKGCDSLKKLPKEIGCLQALTEIVMPDKLRELPEMFGNLQSLLTIDLSHTQISALPYSIGGLVKLRRLNLSTCMKINKLPYSVWKLQSLVELDLSWTSLGDLPDLIANLKQLKVLRMSHMIGITKLPSAIWLVEKLEELDASGCCHLTGEIPKEIGRLSCLRILDLSYTCISILPTMVSCLSNLQILNLESCPKLERLPELPPSLTCLRCALDTLKFCGDRPFVLEWVSARLSSIGSLSQVVELLLPGKNQQFFHQSSHQLPSSLRELELGNLVIERLSYLSNLQNLSTLRLHSCSISKSDAIIAAERSITWEYNKRMREHTKRMREYTKRLQDELLQLKVERLRHLEMHRCTFHSKVLDLSPTKNLEEVNLFGCNLLVEVCGLEELRSLCFLSIVDCSSMEKMSDLSKLRQLRKLRVGKCPELRSMEGLNHLESLQKLWIHDCWSLKSLADTSNLDLQCSTIERCKKLPNPNSYCRCPDNRDSKFTERDHARYF